jgi:hypothetical protein
MMVNADCTLYRYENGSFVRYVLPKVYWRENKAGNVLRSGLATADKVTVYLYDDTVLPTTPTKDLLVKGVCSFDFDNTSAQTISQSMKTFTAQYSPVTVMSVDNMMFGGLPHIEISAR